MSLYEFAVAALVVWRLTHLLAAEDGPWDLIVRVRRRLGHGFWGALLDCFQCLSLWVALPLALVLTPSWRDAVMPWLALSGAAILLEKMTDRPGADSPPPALYFEEEEPPK